MSAWWERPGLEVRDGRLLLAGRDAESLAREHGTPLYVYDLERVAEQARALQDAFARAGQRFRLRYALKANREPALLAELRSLGATGTPGSVGIDVCSPGEVQRALENGWLPEEISYTGTNVSERDLDVMLEHGIHMNLDLVTQVRRYGRRAPGTRAGLRVNPRAGAKSREDTKAVYSSADKPTKFGIYREQLPDALVVAREHDITLDTVHFHVGSGFLTDKLPQYEVALEHAVEMAAWLMEQGCPISEVNAGGGIGVPLREGDEPLDLDAFAQLFVKHVGPLGATAACEPGDFLTKQCGVLLAEVITVEDRLGTTFVGLNAGFNVGPEPFIYGAPAPVVLCHSADSGPAESVTVSGNINEGPDLWGETEPLPEVREGDILAILNLGAYDASMQMQHCMRPYASPLFLTDRV